MMFLMFLDAASIGISKSRPRDWHLMRSSQLLRSNGITRNQSAFIAPTLIDLCCWFDILSKLNLLPSCSIYTHHEARPVCVKTSLCATITSSHGSWSNIQVPLLTLDDLRFLMKCANETVTVELKNGEQFLPTSMTSSSELPPPPNSHHLRPQKQSFGSF